MEDNKEELKQNDNLMKQADQRTQYDKRVCTDIVCLIIGLIFFIGIIIYSLLTANPTHINQTSVPSDSEGKMCGIDYPSHPYIYFTNIPNISSRVCVSHCPQSGDTKLDCVVAGQIGCKFNSIPGFAVVYYDSTPDSDSNGNICMPSDSYLNDQVTTNAKLEGRLLFFKSYQVFVLSLAIAVGLSILYMLLAYCFPKQMVWVTIISSIIVLLGLSVILFLYKTSNKSKIVIGICLTVFLVVYTISVYCNKSAINLSGIFVKEGTKFAKKYPSTLFYIFLFLALTTGFAFLLVWQYRAFISSSTMSFDKSRSLYYTVTSKLIFIKYILLLVHALWGFSLLKECFNFCISNHAVIWYIKKGGGICAIPNSLQLLMFKHLGSMIAGSFVNIFMLIPDIIADLFRFDSSESKNCYSLLDLVRTDSIAFIALTGNPFCNASKYCEYLTYESISTETTQSATRFYRIGAHILNGGAVSIIGLFIKGQIEPYTIIATIFIGIYISTYFISYYADAADAILMMFDFQEQFDKRRQRNKPLMNSLTPNNDNIFMIFQKSLNKVITKIWQHRQESLKMRSGKVKMPKFQNDPI